MARLDEYLTLEQAAARAGIKYQTACLYRQRGTWPEPDRKILGRNLWRGETIDSWASSRRAPGRPAKD